MIHHLPRLYQRTAKPGAEHDSVKAGFEQDQQVVAGNTPHLLGFTEDPAECFSSSPKVFRSFCFSTNC